MQQHLSPADPADLEQALAQALQFDGRKAFRPSSEMMARITASHLIECLRRGGFVIMKAPPPPPHSDAACHPGK